MTTRTRFRSFCPVDEPERAPAPKAEAVPATIVESAGASPQTAVFPREFILAALEQSSDENGWAHLGTFGSYLTKLQPDFDSRVYGFKKLSDLVKAKTDLFVTEERTPPHQSQKQLYLRAK